MKRLLIVIFCLTFSIAAAEEPVNIIPDIINTLCYTADGDGMADTMYEVICMNSIDQAITQLGILEEIKKGKVEFWRQKDMGENLEAYIGTKTLIKYLEYKETRYIASKWLLTRKIPDKLKQEIIKHRQGISINNFHVYTKGG